MENKTEKTEEEKEYPVYKDLSLYVFIIVLGIAYLSGSNIFSIVSPVFGNETWAFALVSIIVGYLINTILYELGKRLFGFIAGYRTVYTNVLCLKWTRTKNKKMKFSFARFEGYGGRTLMAPRYDDYSKCKPALYLLGGTLFTLGLNIISTITFCILGSKLLNPLFTASSLMSLAMGGIICVINAVPLMSDVPMDGFTLRLIKQSEEKMYLFHKNLSTQEKLYTGAGELEEVEVKEVHNLIATETCLYNYYYYIRHDDYASAIKCLDLIIENKKYAQEYIYLEAAADRFYFRLLEEPSEKLTDEYLALPKNLKKTLSSMDYDALKSHLLIAACIELSYDLYDYLSTKIDRKKKHYVFPLRADDEDRLIQKSLEEIERRKPEWFAPYEEEEDEETEEENNTKEDE